jgi:hypothetical protein
MTHLGGRSDCLTLALTRLPERPVGLIAPVSGVLADPKTASVLGAEYALHDWRKRCEVVAGGSAVSAAQVLLHLGRRELLRHPLSGNALESSHGGGG